jgi:flagellin
MAFRMNSNLDALSALFNLQGINDELTLSVKRLSSGLRINSAADDPVGLMIANNYQVQADSLNQVLSNTQSSSNMVKTATGSLSQISSLLSSIRSSVLSASANLTSNPTQAQSDQLSIQSAITSINNIAATTVFGNKSLLDGSAGTSAAVTNSTVVGGLSFGGNFAGGVTQAGNVTITVVNAGTRASSRRAQVVTSPSMDRRSP